MPFSDPVAATRFYHCLIIDLVLVDSCVVRRHKTSQISQRVTHKSSKSLKNVVRVSLLHVDKLEWNPKCFHGLRLDLKFCRIPFFCDSRLVEPNSQLIKLGRMWLPFSTINSNLKLETYTFKHSLTHRLDTFFSRFASTYKIWF